MTYEEAVSYILSFSDLEKSPLRSPEYFDLRRMEELLELLGQPHLRLKHIHIAGTKGKGSTAAMIASVLTAAGFRTALYTSPHLFSIRERLRLNGQPISPEEFTALVERIKPLLERYPSRFGFRTTFEVLTALAFFYFQEKQVEWSVVETGLGGRLDATNVILPEVAVITSISLDHTDVLGHELKQIAWEKAGIIKPGRPVIVAPQLPEALETIAERCRETGSKITLVGRDVTWRSLDENLKGQRLRVYGLRGSYEFFLPLLGDFQQENAATAVAALEQIGLPEITPEIIAQGMSSTSWEARFQILWEKPPVIADGAHNAYSMRCLRRNLERLFQFDRLFVIMGTSLDKDTAGMVAELALSRPEIIVTSSHHPRALPPEKLAWEWVSLGFNPQIAPDLRSALKAALARASDRDLILITGSLFLAAEAIEIFKQGC